MQVTMNIDGSQIGETVLDLFQNLSADDKKSLATQMVREWLLDPAKFEHSSIDARAIKYCRTNASSWDKDKEDHYWRQQGEYRKFIDANPNTKEGMIRSFQTEFAKHAKEEILRGVREAAPI